MIEVSIHPAAEREYEEALRWYYERSPQAAEQFEAEFNKAVDAIAAGSTFYPAIDPVHRIVLVDRFPYQLVYRLDGQRARVVAVAHAKKRPGDWSRRN